MGNRVDAPLVKHLKEILTAKLALTGLKKQRQTSVSESLKASHFLTLLIYLFFISHFSIINSKYINGCF